MAEFGSDRGPTLESVAHLREYLLTRQESSERLQDERLRAHDMASKVQSEELSRRLALLNGEAERLREMQATYLPREVFEDRHKDLEKAIASLREHLDGLIEFRATILGRQTIITIAISAIISGIVASLFKGM